MPDRRRNLLLVTAGFPYGEWERGFISTEFEQLCRDFSVTILSVGRDDPLLYPLPENVRTERLHYKKRTRLSNIAMLRYLAVPSVLTEVLHAVKKAPSVKLALSRLLLITAYYHRAKQAAKVMDRLIKEHRIHTVYTYWATEPAVAACLLKKKHHDLRFVTRFHGHDLYQERKASNWQPFRRYIRDHADRLFFACRAGQDYFVENWGGREKTQLHYLGCGEAAPCVHKPDSILRIVSCSNLIALKQVDRLINGLSQIDPSVQIRWDHFGDGEEARKLHALARSVLKDHISWNFHGHVANHLLRQRFQELDPDVFITTSATEGGVPVSIQEAFSMGIPAIGTAVGGIPEIVIPGKTGMLLPEDPTPRQVAEALMRFRELSPDEKSTLQGNALKLWNTNFRADKNAENFIKELCRIARE